MAAGFGFRTKYKKKLTPPCLPPLKEENYVDGLDIISIRERQKKKRAAA